MEIPYSLTVIGGLGSYNSSWKHFIIADFDTGY